MNEDIKKVYNLRTSTVIEGVAKAPTAERIGYGEIAINYAADHESVFIKNSNDEVVKVSRPVRFLKNDEYGNVFFDINSVYDYIRTCRQQENPFTTLRIPTLYLLRAKMV